MHLPLNPTDGRGAFSSRRCTSFAGDCLSCFLLPLFAIVARLGGEESRDQRTELTHHTTDERRLRGRFPGANDRQLS